MTAPASEAALDFVVRRDDPRVHACRAVARGRAHAGGILLQVDRFGFTANNVTYVALGDRLSYWGFFPATEGWGRIPVWGFATVLESACLINVSSSAHYLGDAELRSALENNNCAWEFKEVVDQFRLYLPEVVLTEAYNLGGFCAHAGIHDRGREGGGRGSGEALRLPESVTRASGY